MLEIVLVLLAFGPPLLWLWFFYSRDKYQPEPKRLILSLFLLGIGASVPALALTAAAQDVFSGVVSAGTDLLLPILLFGLIGAIFQESFKLVFGSVRVRREPEFNEPVDGMLYMVSIGLGFGAALTLAHALDAVSGALIVEPDAGLAPALQVIAFGSFMTALLHVASSGVAGYFYGQHVIGGQPFSRALLGLGAAIAINAFYAWALQTGPELMGPGAVALAPALVVLVVALTIFTYLFRGSLGRSPARTAAMA